MKRMSKETAARNAKCRPVRERLRFDVGVCEICGHDPSRVDWGDIQWCLDVHEIARGPYRVKAIDKPFALLIVCRLCHTERLDTMSHAEQLAALKKSRPGDYDLVAFNELIARGPDRVTEEDVNDWRDKR